MARILFGALHFSYFRNYDSVIRELASRGHDVHLAADQQEAMGGMRLVEQLAADYPGRITWSFAPSLETWRWTPAASWVRRALEYVRFLDPYYDEIPKYRYRARDRSPRVLVWLFRTPGANARPVRQAAAHVLSWFERAIPAPEAMCDFLESHRPDAVLLASVTNPGAPQLDHMKAAMALGVRTAIAVWSWDHLSGKAWLRIAPDRILVWNETQREEARQLHGLPDERIVVTGAQCYDQWFGRAPGRRREEFLRAHGLDPSEELLLYVCSVLVRPAPDEGPFVLDWVRQVRGASDARVRNANILIRPHPERLKEWEGVDVGALGRVAIAGSNPIDRPSRDEYFDSLHHSRAVVGLVTSAFLEAAVVGRPVFTVMLPEFRLFQMGTPHFRYLLNVAGGLLHTADDWARHVAQLTAFFDDPAAATRQLERFVGAFVRPAGLDVPATPAFADAVEQMLGEPAHAGVAARFGTAPGLVAVRGLLELLHAPMVRHAFMSAGESRVETLISTRQAEEQAIKERKRRDYEAREAAIQRARDDKLRQKAGVRKQKEEARAARVRAKRRQRLRARTAAVWMRVTQALHGRSDV